MENRILELAQESGAQVQGDLLKGTTRLIANTGLNVENIKEEGIAEEEEFADEEEVAEKEEVAEEEVTKEEEIAAPEEPAEEKFTKDKEFTKEDKFTKDKNLTRGYRVRGQLSRCGAARHGSGIHTSNNWIL